ncbi:MULTISPECIES: ABC transporter substrate-binding protein [Aerococcus]|nr:MULTISPECIES: ABC transporter substrate-binding protein [Aerococcus]KAA9234662.1 ABC transporter substrate-binding protein [Aerococcus mictus]MDK6375495.1 ABC transporter substrate-binding protein [Aerococcus urinae]MDK6421595.1 ABC transporter substrate-binding protein [Aerococcus urinae]MDK8074389.1 ABC transporter substrate-binding protein [Aerococcus urinae]MDK8083817.1 ABC transporter substrate-binding protein [Aerococcus urinae]
MNKKWLKAFVTLGSVMALAGCGSGSLTETTNQSAENADEIRIGGNWELSGNVSAYGVVQNNAIKLAVDEKNQAGGLLDKKINYLEYDNKSTTEEAVSGAEKLVDENAAVIIGPSTTNNTEATISTVTRAKTPLISATATADNITLDQEGNVLDYIFRICFQDSLQGGSLAEFSNKEGYTKAAIIKDNSSDYGQNLSDEFHKHFDGEVVREESYVAKESDFNSILSNIKNSDAQVIFVAGYYEEAGPIIKQAREMGIDLPILGPDGFGNKEIINLAGEENWDNIYYAAHFVENEDSPQEVKDFLAKYREAYQSEPDMFSALAYDAANLAFDAIERAGTTDGEAVQKALAETKDFTGVTGNFSMDEKHNPSKTVFIQEVKDGQVVGSQAIEAAK